jgi:hypothetical protein
MVDGDRLPLHPVRVLSVPFGNVIAVRFLGPLQGLPTHFYQRHTIACEGDADCPAAAHKQRQVWKYYASSQFWLNSQAVWRSACLEGTEALEEMLYGRELRGEVWMLTREGDTAKKSKVVGTFCERLSDADVPPAFDIEPILLRFYRVKKLLLGLSSPVPRRLLLSDTRAPGPNVPKELQGPTPEEQERNRQHVRELLAKGRERFTNGVLGDKK